MPIMPSSRAELVALFREHYPAPHYFRLAMGDCTIEVRTSTGELKTGLEEYYKEFLTLDEPADILITVHEAPVPDFGGEFMVKAPDPGKARVKEEWLELDGGRVVRKRLTGMHFVFGYGENVAVGPCLENTNQVINFVNNRFIERKLSRGCLLGHAAGVLLDGRGLAIAGFSGMGKSTLALHLMCRGADFVSNDRVMIEAGPGRGLTMYGVAKHPRINPGTALAIPELTRIIASEDRERFLALPPDELWTVEYKYDASIEQCFGPGRFYLRVPLIGLVCLNWKRDGGKLVARRVDPVSRTDLIPAFMKAAGLFYLPADTDPAGRAADHPARPGDQPLAEYIRLLLRCTVLEFTGGVNFDQAADICLDFLRSGVVPGARETG